MVNADWVATNEGVRVKKEIAEIPRQELGGKENRKKRNRGEDKPIGEEKKKSDASKEKQRRRLKSQKKQDDCAQPNPAKSTGSRRRNQTTARISAERDSP